MRCIGTYLRDFCDRMRVENDRFWDANRDEKRKKLKLSRAEVISLAAIVNEESKKVDERPRVAGYISIDYEGA